LSSPKVVAVVPFISDVESAVEDVILGDISSPGPFVEVFLGGDSIVVVVGLVIAVSVIIGIVVSAIVLVIVVSAIVLVVVLVSAIVFA